MEDKTNKYEEEFLEYDENMEYDENEYEIIEVDDDEYETIEVDDDNDEYETIEGEEEEEEKEESFVDEEEENESSIYPNELTDLRLECIYVGMLFNNPKAISRFYFKLEDCHFSDSSILNLYKIVIFREGEAYAPAKAKAGFNLPEENPNVYDLTQQVKRIAASKNYNLEKVYTELMKLFLLKKFYIVLYFLIHF